MYWSIRRELWEHRSIYVAPLAVAGVALFAFSLSSILGIWEKALRLNPEQPQAPFDMAAGLMMLTGIVVSVFYCLDALHSERRDRSILFWKSLPVSDQTTVLAKASIPLVILPLLIFAITVVMQWLMLLLSSAVVMASGQSVATLWTNLPLFRISWLLLYHILTAHALWPAPIYCWLLLVSGWSRRATFLWAVLPVVAIAGDRADCLPHLAFRWSGGRPIAGRRTHRRFDTAKHVPNESHDPHHPASFPGQPGSVDRPGTHRSLPGGSGAAAPLSRTDLRNLSENA